MSYASSFGSAASSSLRTFGTINYLSEVSAVLIAAFLFVTGVLGKEQKNRIAVYKGTTQEDKDKKAKMAASVYAMNDVTTYIGVAALVAMAIFFFGKMKKSSGGGLRLGGSLSALSHTQLVAFFLVFVWLVVVLAENIAVYNSVAVWKQSDKGCPAVGVAAPVVSDEASKKQAKSYYDAFVAFLAISVIFAVLMILSRTVGRKAAAASESGVAGGGPYGHLGYSSVAPSALNNYGAAYY